MWSGTIPLDVPVREVKSLHSIYLSIVRNLSCQIPNYTEPTVFFSFRQLGRIKKTVKNYARVEASIANAYLVREATFFCCHYFERHVNTRSRNVPRNDTGEVAPLESPKILSVFNVSGRVQGRRKNRMLTLQEKEAIRKYVLINCPEVEPYIRLVTVW